MLTEEPSRVFEMWVVWLYTGSLVPFSQPTDGDVRLNTTRLVVDAPLMPGGSARDGPRVEEIELRDAQAWADIDLVRINLFARKYDIPRLEAHALATLVKVNERCNWTASAAAVALAYDALPPDAPMLTYLAENAFECALMKHVATVLIGPTKTEFRVHKEILCCYDSTFFQDALNSSFVEGESQSVWLDSEDEATFGAFLSWLYTGDVALPPTLET
ncbi:hypothetical protein LTR36_005513 [Oleoguttula mirabilis]|uniref:BTB domain-containing protein n=1 Tax=Oleoguttula mirabilis TaxID=1507867 RepID=A0AAV9JEQ2_9PEZI|nr:hypothetical protein LTR36_005513 [Oleoguttula mirabilis]